MTRAPRAEIPKLTELPLELATPRLRLRRPDASDAERLFRHSSDPEVARYVTWTAHTSVDETRAWLQAAGKVGDKVANIVWVIEHAGEPVGAIGLHGIVWELRAVRLDRGELGYWLGREHWGKGLVTEAARAVLDWAFEIYGLHKVEVVCMEANVGSRRVIEKLGARFVGRADADVWRDGAWHAHLKYEMLAP